MPKHLISAAFFLGLSLHSISPAIAQQTSGEGISPAGVEIMHKYYSVRNPALDKVAKDQAEIRHQLQEEAEKPKLDWKKAKALIAAQSEINAKFSALSQANLVGLLERLPEPDRAFYFRSLYRKRDAPEIYTVTTSKPSPSRTAGSGNDKPTHEGQ